MWLTGECLWVDMRDLMSASWLQIVQQNRLRVTQPIQLGLARSLRTNWQACICGYIMLASVKAEKTRERTRVIKMQSELRGRERKNNTRRKVGCNLHTHPSIKAWHRGFVAFEVKLVIPERKQRERKKQRWLCRVTPRSGTSSDFVMQMDRGRCKWRPAFFFWRILPTERNIASLQCLSVGGRAVGAGRYAECFLERHVM